MFKIIIVEDDKEIREELKILLENSGHQVKLVTDFENVPQKIIDEQAHLVLLDINLPNKSGYEICSKIRTKSNIPIIFITSRNTNIDELMAITLGGDDFITKPYNTQILLARISSIIRRAYQNIESEVFEFRRLKYNMSTSEMEFDDKKIELTKNESRILATLIRNKEKIVSRNELMKALWQSDEFVDDNTLTVNINRLRKKLEEIGAKDYLQTKRGQGYILI